MGLPSTERLAYAELAAKVILFWLAVPLILWLIFSDPKHAARNVIAVVK